MAAPKAAFRKPKKSKHPGMILVLLALGVFLALFAYNSISLKKAKAELEPEIARMEKMIEEENDRTVKLKEYETYTHTKKYAEEVAKDKLGYVYDGEIVFQPEDD